jgi:hypothetical protein
MRREKLKLPRAPLPRKTGGAHKRKNKVLPRKAKHKYSKLTFKGCLLFEE